MSRVRFQRLTVSSKGLAIAHSACLLGSGRLHSQGTNVLVPLSWIIIPWYRPASPKWWVLWKWAVLSPEQVYCSFSGLQPCSPVLYLRCFPRPLTAIRINTTWETFTWPSSATTMTYNLGRLWNTASVCLLWRDISKDFAAIMLGSSLSVLISQIRITNVNCHSKGRFRWCGPGRLLSTANIFSSRF